MGRWCGNKIRLHDNRYLHYISTYRVCNQKIKTNYSLSSYTQQYMHMVANNVENPNPRQKVLDNLKLYLSEILEDKFIIMGMEANESVSES
jgi:hypothetical protein